MNENIESMERLRDRQEAGRMLAKKLASYSGRSDVVVLGLPRGGALVASEIARFLKVPLDVLIVRKLRVPGFEDFCMGAISIDGARSINPDVVEEFHLSQADIEQVTRIEVNEMERLNRLYRGIRAPLDVRSRTVILVDDGMTTGATMRAAIASVRQLGAKRVIVAVGVAPLSTYLLLGPEVDEIICLLTPREVSTFGAFYRAFPVISEDRVRSLLQHGKPRKREASA